MFERLLPSNTSKEPTTAAAASPFRFAFFREVENRNDDRYKMF
jgi:hypothetical protein